VRVCLRLPAYSASAKVICFIGKLGGWGRGILPNQKVFFRVSLAQKYPTAQYVISPDWDADDAKTVLIHVKVNSQVVAGVMPVSGLDPALNYDQISKSLPVQPLPQPTQSRTLGANDPLDVSGGERPTRKRWVKGDPPRDHYQEVTDNILSAIESGTAPWQRSWDNVPRWPVNALTNKPYHGINVLMLVSQGFQDQRWCSYKSAKAETWQVRAKEQGTKIYFYKPLQRETGKLDHTGQPEVKTIPLLRSYTIFNLSQMDNAPDLDRTTTAERVLTDLTVQISEEIIEASGAEIVHGYRRAGYSPSEDKVYMPDRASFTSDAEYYSVVLHELAHWTGHETRMAREFGTSRESDEYAREELRAEMASAMIGMRLGLPAAIDGHAAYVEHYMEILRGDKKEVFRAARDAEKIARYVLSFHPEFRDEFEAEHQAQMTAAVSAGAPEDVFDASDFDFEPDFELDSLRP
ncbi:DUF1738 domain-containing protein, partial [Pseudomonas sp. WS 5532]|uniref:ArdC family protein n=1 Tax=Pseudomonas sp. WS 5532 TaxID=2717495 RepID=UPI001476575D